MPVLLFKSTLDFIWNKKNNSFKAILIKDYSISQKNKNLQVKHSNTLS